MPEIAQLWGLDPAVTFLNHGSFGACPLPVLEAQQRLRHRLEADPVGFMNDELEPLADGARAELARFVGAAPEDVAFVTNATSGVNAVLRSLRFRPGDQILTTDHAYNACRNAAAWVASRWGAEVVVADVPFPPATPEEVVASVVRRLTARTRLAVLDHITSATAVVWPIARLVAELAARGVDTLVDGAHAPGMVPLDLDDIGAAYYAGNCHKWVCAPKGAGFLWVRRDRQGGIAPPVISHGLNSPRTDRSRFQLLFGWVGTADPTPWLAIPDALAFMSALDPAGWEGVMAANRVLALRGRDIVAGALGIGAAAPDAMVASMVSLPLPPADGDGPTTATGRDALELELATRERIRVPVTYWPRWPYRLVRISAQRYNAEAQYRRLAAVLGDRLAVAR